MKTIELTKNRRGDTEEQIKEAGEQAIILTFGYKPVVILLPIVDNIAHLSKFERVIDSEESVTLTIEGRPIAIVQTLVPLVVIEDAEIDLETAILSTDPKFLELIERSRQRHKAEGGISSDEMRQRLGV
jgi:hypothetical protein